MNNRRFLHLLLFLLVLTPCGLAGCQSQSSQAEPPRKSDPFTPADVGMATLQSIPEPVTLLASGNTLYIASAPCAYGTGCSFVYSMPLTGGAATKINNTSAPCTVSGLVDVGGGILYAAARACSQIGTLSLVSGEWETLWQGAPLVKPARMVRVGNDIYIADIDAGPDGSGAIFRMPIGGGTPVVVYQGLPLVDPTGITATPAGDALYICDQNGPQGAEPRSHSDPGGPGLIFKLSIASKSQPTLQLIAQGGSLKNPLDLQLVGDTLYIGDEGVATGSPQGVYKLSVAGINANSNVAVVTQSITALYAGAPFVEPIGLTYANGKLYIADDAGNTVYSVPVPSSPAPSPTTPSGPASRSSGN
jgi:hypothetical protein